MLSADPNSLANLDQGKLCEFRDGMEQSANASEDLPNNLQRDVPIVSRKLPWVVEVTDSY